MTLTDPRSNTNSVVTGNNFGPALGAEVAITLLKKQLDATKVQGAAAISLLESANPSRPSPSADGKVGTHFAAYA